MCVEEVVNGINESSLPETVKKEAVEIVKKNSGTLESRYEVTKLMSNEEGEERYKEIAEYALDLLMPIFKRENISVIKEDCVYVQIHKYLSSKTRV